MSYRILWDVTYAAINRKFMKRGIIELVTAVVTDETVVVLTAITVDVFCDVDNGNQ